MKEKMIVGRKKGRDESGGGKGCNQLPVNWMGDVAALLRSHMIGLQPSESTIEQTKETVPLSLKQ